MPKTLCNARHTDYQPAEKDWRCPRCGAGIHGSQEGMVIESCVDDADPNCVKIHPGDEITCHACNHSWSGTILVRALKKRDHVKTCPTCKGSGVIPDS